MHDTLIAVRIWIILSPSTKWPKHHRNEIPLADVLPGWEKSLSETEKWTLANLFDWFVYQIIQRRKLLTRCTRIKVPPWPSFPPPSAPPWTASAPPPSPAPSAQREPSIKYQYLDHHHHQHPHLHHYHRASRSPSSSSPSQKFEKSFFTFCNCLINA